MKRFFIVVLAALLVLGAVAVTSAVLQSSGAQAADRQQWEYMYVKFTEFGDMLISTDRVSAVREVLIDEPVFRCDEEPFCMVEVKDQEAPAVEWRTLVDKTITGLGQDGWEIYQISGESRYEGYMGRYLFMKRLK